MLWKEDVVTSRTPAVASHRVLCARQQFWPESHTRPVCEGPESRCEYRDRFSVSFSFFVDDACRDVDLLHNGGQV